ncbi:hypothetical protein ACQEU3_09355 [Spirillospora sp. CA-253888]
MTAKTPKDVTEDAAETSAAEVEAPDEAAEDAAAGEDAAAPRPAKRKRRVRVIEVIEDDDEDLDDVLEALDAEEEPPARRPAARKAAPAAAAAEKPAAKKSAERQAVEEDEEEAEPAPRPSGPSGPKEPVSLDKGKGGSLMPLVPLVVGVVLVALLATLAIWQWRTASGLSGTEDDREQVAKVASDYGNVALNYNATNYQSQMDKAQKLMGGDLLENFKQCTLPNLGATFKDQPQLSLTSKTTQTFVGSVDARFATATIAVDVGVSNAGSPATNVPSNLIRLSLSKTGGTWKVTQQFASGANEQKRGCDEQIPGVPGGTGADKDKNTDKKKEEKPKN